MEGFSSQPNQAEWHPQPNELHDLHNYGTPIERLESGRPQLEQLVTEMAPDIRAGRWDVLLGDDVSGRLPTLVLRGVLKRVYADQGRPAPRTYFVPMGQEFSYIDLDHPKYADEDEYYIKEREEIERLVQQRKDYLESGIQPKRVLFVTDNVALGGSIGFVQETLDNLGIPSDVASAQERTEVLAQMTHEHRQYDPDSRCYGVEYPNKSRSQPFHVGRFGAARSRAAVGVEKYGGPITEDPRQHAFREREGREPQYGDRLPPQNSEVAEIRQAIDTMAADIYQKLFAS